MITGKPLSAFLYINSAIESTQESNYNYWETKIMDKIEWKRQFLCMM